MKYIVTYTLQRKEAQHNLQNKKICEDLWMISES